MTVPFAKAKDSEPDGQGAGPLLIRMLGVTAALCAAGTFVMIQTLDPNLAAEPLADRFDLAGLTLGVIENLPWRLIVRIATAAGIPALLFLGLEPLRRLSKPPARRAAAGLSAGPSPGSTG